MSMWRCVRHSSGFLLALYGEFDAASNTKVNTKRRAYFLVSLVLDFAARGCVYMLDR